MLRRAFPIALVLTACGGAPAAPIVAPSSPVKPAATNAQPDATAIAPGPDVASLAARGALDRFLKEAWDAKLASDPVFASENGDRRWNDKWPDVSLDALARERERTVRELDKLHAIRRDLLPADKQLDYDLFERDAKELIEGAPYFADKRFPTGFALLPLNQRDGIQIQGEVAELLRFETTKDYDDWIGRIHAFPLYMDQTIALMREAIKRHFVQPHIVMDRVVGQIEKQLGPAEGSEFYKPFKKYAAGVPQTDRDRLSRAAKEGIEKDVIPAFKRFKEFFVKEYLPATFGQVGAWQLPDGAAFYAYSARVHTTTKLTPKEIHETGLKEVARIRSEMQSILTTVGFKGSLKEFFAFLRTDSRFYYKRPEDLLEGYRAIAKRIDPTLIRLFKTLPRTPYGVEPIPAASAPDTTTAYYQQAADDGSRAGTFYVNLYKPEARPKWEMMALALHESVPGHHLQIAIGQEHGDLPDFRRNSGYSAFAEGWGLYAESLGSEAGLYDDPYLKFGQLTYEMWRAVRLVVDTGMHEMRWTRKQAIAYFMDNAAKTELDVTNEVDRYIAWPGQALAYKVGELKIKELRAKASAALGAAFDVRVFHDVVLEEGAVPLDVLEAHVNAWIAQKQSENRKAK